MHSLISILSSFADWLWGPPLLILLVGGGIFLTLRLGFFQIRYFRILWIKLSERCLVKQIRWRNRFTFPSSNCSTCFINRCSKYSSCAFDYFIAGPGSILWMWITAIVGQATKFGEIVLGILYRQKNEDGEYVGGACYYLQHGNRWKNRKNFRLTCSIFSLWLKFYLQLQFKHLPQQVL